MRNILIICRKELRSYFASPIAYLLLTMFALIFGFFFWNALGYFVLMGMESQMRGQMMQQGGMMQNMSGMMTKGCPTTGDDAKPSTK